MIYVYSLGETIEGLKEAVEQKRVQESQVELYLEMLNCEEKLTVDFSVSEIDSEGILARWQKNVPALDEGQTAYDLSVAYSLFKTLALIFLGHFPQYKDEVEKVLIENRSDFLRNMGTEKVCDSPVIHFLAAHAVHPFQVKLSKAVLERGAKLERWTKGFCPLCGGLPDIAALEREVGRRTLLCSRCDCEWPYQRIGCPFCENQDSNKIFYYTDEMGIYRLYLCEKCEKYLKTVDLRELAKPIALSAERYLTQSVDAAARKIR